MASSTKTPEPVDGTREPWDQDRPERALENRASVDNGTVPDRNASVVLGAAVFTMGLVAGLYFFSAVAVMPALSAADDRTLIDAMQHMIVEIENPAFFLVFFGAPTFAALALARSRRAVAVKTARWVGAGLALYALMLMVTFVIHVPLNYDLKDLGDPARIENLAAARDAFVTPWITWEIVRTLASIAAFGCLTWALVLRARMACA